MATKSFATDVSQWVRDVKAYHEAVFREAVQRITDEMQTPRGQGGNLPVDTGFLWHSLVGSTESMPTIRDGNVPKRPAGRKPGDPPIYAYENGPVNLVINTAEVGVTIYLGYTAAYAAIVHDRGALWVDLAAQRWPAIVKQVEEELAGRLER